MKCNNAIRVSSLLGLVSDMKPKFNVATDATKITVVYENR